MSRSPSPTLSDSALLDSLADSFDLDSHREARMEALAQQIKQVKDLRESDNGRVVTFGEEKALIERMAKEKYCLLHFFHPDFARCQIMDRQLAALAPSHPHTLFARASVDDVPFLVTKMAVQVLPCVLCFVDGRAVDRLIGFEELGDTDQFTAKMLEFRLKQSGVLPSNTGLAGNINSALLTQGSSSRSQGQSKGRDARSGSESEDSEDERRRKSGVGRTARRGKVGIRNGLGGGDSDDDW
ncbi:hypothetical protein IAT38_007033 [Cryptococcus sp. DSM 104549]